MSNKKKVILTFIGYYLPGYKSGGPVRTVSNMLNALSDYYDFKIVTRDRDSLENKPYDGIKVNEWNDAPNCKIYYKSPSFSLFTDHRSLITEINSIDFDMYYLNSYFDFYFSIKIILLKKLKLIPVKPILLAPRGELSLGALSIRSLKKRVYLSLSKLLNLYNNIAWHASSKYEEEEIKREFGKDIEVKIAMDIPDFNLPKVERTHKKVKGKLKILFISSIVPKKNLMFVIDTLNKVEGDFTLDIYGPIKDQKYWRKCLNSISDRIKDRITYKGTIPNDQIHTVYPNYDLFFFPTLGENFGHVIYESIYYGTPVLCSDQTPWDSIEGQGAGWEIPLNKKERYKSVIDNLFNLEDEKYYKMSESCDKLIMEIERKNKILKNLKRLFS